MPTEKISSKENKLIKQFVKLSGSKQQRRQEGLFAAEGIKIIQEAVQSGFALKTLFFTEQAEKKYGGDIKFFAESSQTFYIITEDIAKKISETQTPQGVFALIAMLDNKPNTAKIFNNGCFAILNSLQDPGNIGTIIRTAAAFGIDGLFLSSDCPDIYSPKILRSTMGGVFKLPVYTEDNIIALIGEMRASGITVYAASLDKKSLKLGGISFSSGAAVVIGNEGNGLPQSVIDACDKSVIIPMQGSTESLNAATAAAVLMWEMTKHKLN